MSEKIYACLLRLFPSHFRESYGEDALQLFRDRATDERGWFPRLRLWTDLLVDLAVSVPGQYRYVQPELIGVAAHRGDGVPVFYVLGNEAPRPRALVLGSLVTLAALSTFWVLLNQAKGYAGRGVMTSGEFQGSFRSGANPNPEPVVAGRTNAAAALDKKLGAAERRRVINAAAESLRKFYVDRDNAQKMADALLTHERRGDDDVVTDGRVLAALLTWQMKNVSHDRHLVMFYSQSSLPGQPNAESPEALARYRDAMEQENCTFETVAILPHNVGYLKLNSFPDPQVCQKTAEAAMATLNRADAIIYDLRDNGGGEPEMTAFLGSYLFDHPEYWYNPRENTTERSWTRSPVQGNRLVDKPVYLLTSRRTFSGAEQFCYDLKMLKRATLVGETTGGAAHSGVWHRIDDHFGMLIPETKPINPFSQTDWAETGVEPDVKVKAASALETAKKLALRHLQRK